LAIPVINIGSITVGGTGKTPLVLWLARFLREQGYKPGVISCGYDGNSEIWPLWVDEQSPVEQVGEEAVLMSRRLDCPVAVGPEIVKTAQMVLDKSDSNVIIINDGLQQYSVKNDIEIIVIDGERRFGNGYMLPCGPLREPIDRLHKVDLLIVNGTETEENEYTMQIESQPVTNCVTKEEKLLSEFSKQSIHALAGIGNPKNFFDLLEQENISLDSHAFPSHHQFTINDIRFEDDKPVLMTEKDAVKCSDFVSDKHWY
jgi:tetraacyldisaccharide 4'-kinase